jgi:hypothetical protein
MTDDHELRPGGPIAGDEFVYALAASPLALPLASLPGAGPRALLVLPLLLAVQAAAVILDRRRLLAVDAPGRPGPPSWAWFPLPGAYLGRRCRALGRRQDLASAWACASLVAIGQLAFSAALDPGDAAAVDRKPPCAHVTAALDRGAGAGGDGGRTTARPCFSPRGSGGRPAIDEPAEGDRPEAAPSCGSGRLDVPCAGAPPVIDRGEPASG